MKTALVVMTIMGCDDSVTHCDYLQTVDSTWQTVALCDAETDAHMNRVQNENYPVIVAVCESAHDRVTLDMAGRQPDSPSAGRPASDAPADMPEGAYVAVDDAVETEEARQSLAARAIDVVRRALPDGAAVKSVVSTPVRVVEDGYSWVVRRFTD